MSELKMWHDGEDWVVAESAEEAQRITIELTGISAAETPVDGWSQVPMGRELSFDHGDERPKEKRTTAEWIAINGKGHWASVNW